MKMSVSSMLWILCSFLMMTACSDLTSTAPPPTGGPGLEPGIDLVYDNVISSQQRFIRSLQLPDGALRDTPQLNSRINPYFANYAAMALLTDPTENNQRVVQKYMGWYMGKLNGSRNPVTGEQEIPGSIYDYYGKAETTEGKYDSIDSYAATFLELAMRYARISPENEAWLKKHAGKISSVASAMVKMIDTPANRVPSDISPDADDYLSVASFVYPAKYLMDNSEVNMGLRAAEWLKGKGLLDSEEDFPKLLRKNSEAIAKLFRQDTYNWEKSNTANWMKFYPDAVAQLYPAIFEVSTAGKDRSGRLYTTFNNRYAGWEDGTSFDPFPWTIISYAAAMENDVKRVEAYMTHINSFNIKGQQKKGWYSAEAAFVLLAIDRVLHP